MNRGRHAKRSGRYAAPKAQTNGRFMGAVIAVATILSLVGLVGTAQAGGDNDVSAEWKVLDTTYEEGFSHWTPDAVQADSATSQILSPTEALLSWSPTAGVNELGTSIETTDLDGLTVQNHPDYIDPETGEPVPAFAYFQFELLDGAQYGAGSPRLFVGIDTNSDGVPDVYRNTFDHGYPLDDDDAANGYNTAVTLPEGTVVHVGIVLDGIPGDVKVERPVVGDVAILFEEDETVIDPEPENGGPPHDGGSAVAEFVKAAGGPPPHANAKSNR